MYRILRSRIDIGTIRCLPALAVSHRDEQVVEVEVLPAKDSASFKRKPVSRASIANVQARVLFSPLGLHSTTAGSGRPSRSPDLLLLLQAGNLQSAGLCPPGEATARKALIARE